MWWGNVAGKCGGTAVLTPSPPARVAAAPCARACLQELAKGLVVEGCPAVGVDGAYVAEGEWDGRPLYKRADGVDTALYWCRGTDQWIFCLGCSELTEVQKKSTGTGYAWRQAEGGQ